MTATGEVATVAEAARLRLSSLGRAAPSGSPAASPVRRPSEPVRPTSEPARVAAPVLAPTDVTLDAATVVRRWCHELDGLAADRSDEAEDVELLAALEELKSTACAVQARLAVRVDSSRRAAEAADGVPLDRRGRGVPVQLGLARRESPHRARMLLGAAKAWMHEMPHTFAALERGRLSEHRALLLVRETACLPVETRAEVDRLVCADASSLAELGTRRLVALARQHAARLEPASLAARARRAEGERAVTLRPAPDTMAYLTALLPVAQGVAALAALQRTADAARSAGDARSRGQLMADVLIERVTGQAAADAVPVTVNLVMSDAVLLGAAHDGAGVEGHGVVPAQVARNLVAHGLDAGAAWVRRLYADPAGDLLATSSSARFHAPGLAALLRVRDQGLCRTPYCDAPARESDHVVPADDGGPTDLENGQGLCVACNRAKQAPGWVQRPDAAERARVGRHVVLTTTPTGHRYRSTAPRPPAPLRAGMDGAWAPPGGAQPAGTELAGTQRAGAELAGTELAGTQPAEAPPVGALPADAQLGGRPPGGALPDTVPREVVSEAMRDAGEPAVLRMSAARRRAERRRTVALRRSEMACPSLIDRVFADLVTASTARPRG